MRRIHPSHLSPFHSRCLALLLGAALIASTDAQAQTRRAMPDSMHRSLEDTASIEQQLVALALAGPEAQQVTHQNKINEYQLKAAKNAWLNLLTVSGNYNDQTFAKQTPTTTVVYPKVFFGVTIPIGTLFSRTSVKAANESVEIGKLTQEEVRRKIKADVLTKYKQYKAQGEIIAIETGLMNDLQATFLQAEDRFRKNTITFDVYNTSLRNKNDQQTKLINLRLQRDVTKLELERMIGTNLESVTKNTVQ